MNAREIIDRLARERAVEQIAHRVCRVAALTADQQDLCQMVYLALLDYDEDRIVDLWEHNEMGFFIAALLRNQYNSSTSPFHYLIRRPQQLSREIAPRDERRADE